MWPVERKDKEKHSRQLRELLKFKLCILHLALHIILEFPSKISSEIRDDSPVVLGKTTGCHLV